MDTLARDIAEIFGLIVPVGLALAPIVFGAMQIFKVYIPSKHRPVSTFLFGLVIGLILVPMFRHLGLVEYDWVVGVMSGLFAGYIAAAQYDSATEDEVEIEV